MIAWPLRRKPQASDAALEMHAASVASLADAKQLRQEAAEVSSDLRERRRINHFRDGFVVAMGGTP